MRRIAPFLWIAVISLAMIGLAQSSLGQKQSAALHWNYLGHALFFIPPIVGLIADRKNVDAYGLRADCFIPSAKIGLLFAVLLIALPLIADALFGTLALRPVVQGRVFQTLFFKFVMVGIAEELLFRGYVQGELNGLFTKRYQFLGASVTHSYWITVIVFAACHCLPGLYVPALWEMAYVLGAAVLFGLLREWTQSLAASVLVHFGLHVHRTLFGVSLSSGIATGLAWFIGFWFLAKYLTGNRTATGEPMAA
jgi:membrane protease YdiL (CAAX protease family)